VKLLPTGEPYLGLQALERGVVDAAAMSIPYLFIARKAGFRELADFDKLGVEYPYTSVVVLRQTVVKNPDLIESFLKCIIEGTHILKTNKAKTLAGFKRYMKGADDEMLEETYQSTRPTLDERAVYAPAGGEERVGNPVVAISSGEANRRELDRRAIDHEKD